MLRALAIVAVLLAVPAYGQNMSQMGNRGCCNSKPPSCPPRNTEAWCDSICGPIGIMWVRCIERARGLIK